MGKVIGLLPMRDGSKRFPNKHTAEFLNEPIYRFALRALLQAKEVGLIDEVIVSTNSYKVTMDAALKYWSDQAIMLSRPDNLYDDKATINDVVNYAKFTYEGMVNDEVDAVIVTYSHSVFATPFLMTAALRNLENFESCIAAYQSPVHVEFALDLVERYEDSDVKRSLVRRFRAYEGKNSNDWETPWYDTELLYVRNFNPINGSFEPGIGLVPMEEKYRCIFHTPTEYRRFKAIAEPLCRLEGPIKPFYAPQPTTQFFGYRTGPWED